MCVAETPEGFYVVAYCYQSDRGPEFVAYKGRQSKPARFYAFPNEERRELETVLARLKAGDIAGQDHDDDFGYSFEYAATSPAPSFFDAPADSD